MASLSSATWKKVTDAVRVIHAHGQGELSSRLFQASSMLFEDTYTSFEIYGKDGSHLIWENVPFPESRRAAIQKRIGEVVPFEHPAFPYLLKGERDSMRISDLITQPKLLKTHLYNEIFREVEVKYQLVMPIYVPNGIGGMTLNRGGSDYTDEDLFVATLMAPHVITAYESDLLLNKSLGAMQQQAKLDYTKLRKLGLTKRQCEVMGWMVEGKRDSEIAMILERSVRTVNVHVSSILAKLGVETRTTAVARVINEGLL